MKFLLARARQGHFFSNGALRAGALRAWALHARARTGLPREVLQPGEFVRVSPRGLS